MEALRPRHLGLGGGIGVVRSALVLVTTGTSMGYKLLAMIGYRHPEEFVFLLICGHPASSPQLTAGTAFIMKVNSILAAAFVGGASASPTKLEARQGVSPRYHTVTSHTNS